MITLFPSFDDRKDDIHLARHLTGLILPSNLEISNRKIIHSVSGQNLERTGLIHDSTDLEIRKLVE